MMEAHGFIVSESKHSIQLIPKKLNKSFDFDIFNILNKIDTEPIYVYHMHFFIEIYSRKSSICVHCLPSEYIGSTTERKGFSVLDPVKVLSRVTVIKIPPVEN